MASTTDAVLKAVADLNCQLAPAQRLPLNPQTALVGPGSVLDSLALIHLIVGVEQRVSAELGTSVVLTEERTLGDAPRVLATVQSLADHIDFLIREKESRGASA
jgi:acyl carrier protein